MMTWNIKWAGKGALAIVCQWSISINLMVDFHLKNLILKKLSRAGTRVSGTTARLTNVKIIMDYILPRWEKHSLSLDSLALTV
jgi:hypothetical protein